MVCGHLPFYSDDHEMLVRLVLSTRYQVADCVCREDAELIQSMLQLAPQDRASIDELCALPFLVATNALEPPESPRSPRLGPLGMSPIGSWSMGINNFCVRSLHAIYIFIINWADMVTHPQRTQTRCHTWLENM
jgi:hypothetical protein